MTDPDERSVSGDDVLAALDRFSHDVSAANEAVLTRLTDLVSPGRRSVLRRRRRVHKSEAALLAPKKSTPRKLSLAALPTAAAGGTLWGLGLPALPAAVELLPILAHPGYAPYVMGASVIAGAVGVFAGAPEATQGAVTRLQETARAGVVLTLEMASLQVALNDARSNPASAAEILSKAADGADRVTEALAVYLDQLDQAHAAGDLDVRFPWAVELENSPLVRLTLTVDGESVLAGVRELAQHPEHLVPDPGAAADATGMSVVATTANDLAGRIDALVATVEEAGERAYQIGVRDVRSAFAQAWTEGMFAFAAVTEVRRTGDAAGGTIEQAVRRFSDKIDTALATLPRKQARVFSTDFRERLTDAAREARQLILSAQYVDALVRDPGMSAKPVSIPAVRRVDITVQEVATLAAELRRTIAMSARRLAETRAGFDEPGIVIRLEPGLGLHLNECARSAARADEHLGKVLERTTRAGITPTASMAIARLANSESDLDGARAACESFDAHIAYAARYARLRYEYDPTGLQEQRAVLEYLEANPQLPAATNLDTRWQSLLDHLEQLAARE